MSATRNIELPPEFAATRQRLAGMGQRGLQIAASSVDRTNQEVIGHIVAKRLSKRGPDTLGRVTSRLARSVNATPARLVAGSVVSQIGTNVEYAAIHEFGFKGPVAIRAHRRSQAAYAFGRPNPNAGQPVAVRAHRRKLDVPARRWLSAGLEDREADYARNLTADLDEALAL